MALIRRTTGMSPLVASVALVVGLIVAVPADADVHPATTLIDGSMTSVSCPSDNFCMAVGTYKYPARPVAQTWNGTVWHIVKMPDPADPNYVRIESVSCVSSSFCVAVGVNEADPNGRRRAARTLR